VFFRLDCLVAPLAVMAEALRGTPRSSPISIVRLGPTSARFSKAPSPPIFPWEQPTKFEFIINLKTAKALGLNIPSGVLAIADEVIE
jgi:hypothetical protein